MGGKGDVQRVRGRVGGRPWVWVGDQTGTGAEGVEVVAALGAQARERFTSVVGGGIREPNVRFVIARSGVREVHARLVDEVQMRRLVEVAKKSSVARDD